MDWFLYFMRWGHFVAGITWIGLLYFFNLVNAKFKNMANSNFMASLDGPTKLKVYPLLMPKALWWFRWGALWTVIFGLAMYGVYLPQHMTDEPTKRAVMLVWAGQFVIYILNFYAISLTADDKNAPVHNLMILFVLILCGFGIAAPYVMGANYYATGITVGGGFGILMLLNVWGVIWRLQKKIIQANIDQANGQPAPADLAKLSKVAGVASRTNFWLSLPMLFFMGSMHLPHP